MLEITHIDIGPMGDGKAVGLKAIGSDGTEVTLKMPLELIETLVVGVLDSAAVCAELNKSKLQTFAEMPDLKIHATARGVAAQDLPERHNMYALLFQFGQTRLGIGLSKDGLRTLGSSLLAASADSSKPQ